MGEKSRNRVVELDPTSHDVLCSSFWVEWNHVNKLETKKEEELGKNWKETKGKFTPRGRVETAQDLQESRPNPAFFCFRGKFWISRDFPRFPAKAPPSETNQNQGRTGLRHPPTLPPEGQSTERQRRTSYRTPPTISAGGDRVCSVCVCVSLSPPA